MKRLIYILLVLGIVSCEKQKEYKALANEVGFKYHQFGESEKIGFDKTLQLALTVTSTKGDTIHYVPNYSYFISLEDSQIDSLFSNLHLFDSVTFKMPEHRLKKYFNFFGLNEDSSLANLNVRVQDVFVSKDKAKNKEYKIHSEREVKEQAELNTYLNTLEGNAEKIGGIYRLKTKENKDGAAIAFGDEVTIHYKGSFLNGYVFDNTYEKGLSPSFVYGQEYQMIEGMQLGLSGIREGESVKIILPSRLAFGEQGSMAGIVPPYTSVVFEVEILKIIKTK